MVLLCLRDVTRPVLGGVATLQTLNPFLASIWRGVQMSVQSMIARESMNGVGA